MFFVRSNDKSLPAPGVGVRCSAWLGDDGFVFADFDAETTAGTSLRVSEHGMLVYENVHIADDVQSANVDTFPASRAFMTIQSNELRLVTAVRSVVFGCHDRNALLRICPTINIPNGYFPIFCAILTYYGRNEK
jgi:hypothetical protein